LYENKAEPSLLLIIAGLLRPFLRGRRPVRSGKNQPKPPLLLSITAFSVRMFFIRTENTVGARSAKAF
jgi:hypothetical protein